MPALRHPHLISLAINLIAALVFSIVSTFGAKYFIPDLGAWLDKQTSVSFPNLLLFVVGLALICFAIIFTAFVSRYATRLKVTSGREDVMADNLASLKARYSSDEVFWSTRLTFWNVSEQSPARIAFRAFITQAVQERANVRRIWHVKNGDGYNRLRLYLDTYKGYENYHIKTLITEEVYMPELTGIGDKIAMISVPTLVNPAIMISTMQFRRRSDARVVREFFDVVWDRALPIKVGEHIYAENLERVRISVGATTA